MYRDISNHLINFTDRYIDHELCTCVHCCVCVCVHVCVHVRACARVCVCVCAYVYLFCMCAKCENCLCPRQCLKTVVVIRTHSQYQNLKQLTTFKDKIKHSKKI